MLFVSLVLAALLLAAANRAAFRSRHPRVNVLGLCLAFLAGPVFLGMILPPVVILAALLPIAVIVWKESSGRPPVFLRLSLGAAAVAVVVPTLMALNNVRGYERLRTLYPLESMEDRVPAPSRGGTPSPEALGRLDEWEWKVSSHDLRGWRLQRLHEDTVGLFINSSGFGVSRMNISDPSESGLASGLHNRPTPVQPGPRPGPARSPGEWAPLSAAVDTPPFALHESAILYFVNSPGFGYVKDRRHVAGFQPHRFRGVPEEGPWKVRTLDLVGLLLHDEPRVYVSEKLPSMNELRGAPTRPLDPFEAQALGTIEGGDDLVIVRDGDVTRMLGAIRSTRQCLACHGGERGDLLGAFSYTLRRGEGKPADGSHPVASNEPRPGSASPSQ